MRRPLTCVEICAGAGGQALGLAMAGFVHVALVEYEQEYCNVLKANRPEWNVICADVHKFDGHPYEGVDLLAGGVPCPPFSVAGKQLGKDDERDLFPEAIRLIREIRPRAVMLENVRGFLDSGFEEYRELESEEAVDADLHRVVRDERDERAADAERTAQALRNVGVERTGVGHEAAHCGVTDGEQREDRCYE